MALATCSTHGKQRSIQSLMDDGAGGMTCSPGNECRTSRFAAEAAATPVVLPDGSATAPCSVHGKQRSADSLMPDGMGAYMCLPGKECKTSGAPGTKRSLCKFWQESRCANGAGCSFAHGEEEIGMPIPAQTSKGSGGSMGWGTSVGSWGSGKSKGKSKGKDSWGADSFASWNAPWNKGSWGGGWGGDSWGDAGWWDGWGKMGMKGFGKMMSAFSSGKGSSSWGSSSSWGTGKGKGSTADHGALKLCSKHGKHRSENCLDDLGDGTYSCKEGMECKGSSKGSGFKRTMCKFFQLGQCTKGELCTFAHSDEEIGEPIPGDHDGSAAVTTTSSWPAVKGGYGKGARYSPY